LALLRQISERIEEQVAQAMRESADADEEETVRRLLSAFAHTLLDDPRVAIVTFGEAADIRRPDLGSDDVHVGRRGRDPHPRLIGGRPWNRVLLICSTMAHMSEAPVRELNQNTAGVLARVKRGEQIDITERGVVVARLVPSQENPLAEMISAGRLHPATLSGPAPRPSGPVKTDNEAGQVLRELRDTERY
jgi:prevent-host-death family protein